MSVYGVTLGRDAIVVCFPTDNKKVFLKEVSNFHFQLFVDTLLKGTKFPLSIVRRQIEKRYQLSTPIWWRRDSNVFLGLPFTVFTTVTCKMPGVVPGGYPRQLRIGVCRQGSQTLTLFKGRKSRIDTLLKAQTKK